MFQLYRLMAHFVLASCLFKFKNFLKALTLLLMTNRFFETGPIESLIDK